MNFIKNTIIVITIALCLVPALAISQTVNPDIEATTPDSKFTDNGNGTVTDLNTGLMWKKNHESEPYSWSQALQRVQNVNSGGGFAGYTDWRVPNLKELKSIIEEKCYDPAINLNIFPGTPSNNFWSSSSVAHIGQNAWYFDFKNGFNRYDHEKEYYRHYVRLVRGGQ